MRENRVKRIIREGGLAFSAYTGSFTDPAIVELIGLAGFDAAFIDMEHTTYDLGTVAQLIRAAEVVGITPVVRIPENNAKLILRLLDAGAQGIYVPHIDGAADARAAVSAVRFPPLGDRGVHPSVRAADYGEVPFAEHLTSSNEQVLLVVMIEDTVAVAEIEAIASTDGIDLVAIGPSDLARALGVAGQTNHPKLVETIEHVAAAVRQAGRKLAFPLQHPVFPRSAAALKAMGVGYCNCAPGPEVRLLRSLQEQVRTARAALAERETTTAVIDQPRDTQTGR